MKLWNFFESSSSLLFCSECFDYLPSPYTTIRPNERNKHAHCWSDIVIYWSQKVIKSINFRCKQWHFPLAIIKINIFELKEMILTFFCFLFSSSNRQNTDIVTDPLEILLHINDIVFYIYSTFCRTFFFFFACKNPLHALLLSSGALRGWYCGPSGGAHL